MKFDNFVHFLVLLAVNYCIYYTYANIIINPFSLKDNKCNRIVVTVAEEEDLNRVRDEGISFGMSQQRNLGNVTPPSSPAEFNTDKVTPSQELFITNEEPSAPTAEPESSDLSFQPNNSITKITTTTINSSSPNVIVTHDGE